MAISDTHVVLADEEGDVHSGFYRHEVINAYVW
jgi:hypothetical protein